MMNCMFGECGLPFFGRGMMLIWFIIFLIIAFFIYQDANKRGMNGLLWAILVIIPMVGLLFLIIYIIIREFKTQAPQHEEKTPMEILKERYAKGEINPEEFQKISEDLNK